MEENKKSKSKKQRGGKKSVRRDSLFLLLVMLVTLAHPVACEGRWSRHQTTYDVYSLSYVEDNHKTKTKTAYLESDSHLSKHKYLSWGYPYRPDEDENREENCRVGRVGRFSRVSRVRRISRVGRVSRYSRVSRVSRVGRFGKVVGLVGRSAVKVVWCTHVGVKRSSNIVLWEGIPKDWIFSVMLRIYALVVSYFHFQMLVNARGRRV